MIIVNPGMTAIIILDITDNNGMRLDPDSGSIPAITRVFMPGFTLDTNLTFPISLTKLDVGLYHGAYLIQKGSTSLGNYIIDVRYTLNTNIVTKLYQVQVSMPFGSYSIGIT